jgi:hypothetical protein
MDWTNTGNQYVPCDVVHFLDTNSNKRWFERDYETLGTIEVLYHDFTCVNRAAVTEAVQSQFGTDAYAVML